VVGGGGVAKRLEKGRTDGGKKVVSNSAEEGVWMETGMSAGVRVGMRPPSVPSRGEKRERRCTKLPELLQKGKTHRFEKDAVELGVELGEHVGGAETSELEKNRTK
jgi:hypothetical protein